MLWSHSLSPCVILVLEPQNATYWIKLKKHVEGLIDNTRPAEATTKQFYTKNILSFINIPFSPLKDTNWFIWIVINLGNVPAFEPLLKILRVIEKCIYYSTI